MSVPAPGYTSLLSALHWVELGTVHVREDLFESQDIYLLIIIVVFTVMSKGFEQNTIAKKSDSQ